MPILLRRSASAGLRLLASAFLLCLLGLSASRANAQEDAPAPPTPAQKVFDRIDFAVSAAGEFGSTVSGIEQRDQNTTHSLLTDKPSSTVGELVTLRYTARPWVGFEFNFGNQRFSQNYTFVPQTVTVQPFDVQAGVRELTLGYVAHLKYRPFGLTPFLGAGGGTIHFTPTPGGGFGLPPQYRAAYYYQAGVEDTFPNSHFGMRVAFRQLIYLAPDFIQNYLTITRRTINTQPTIGFFVKF